MEHHLFVSDYFHLKKQIESELVDSTEGQLLKSFLDLPKMEQQLKLKERLKKYCQKVYMSFCITYWYLLSGQLIFNVLMVCERHIKGFSTSLSLNFEKQGYACVRILFMWTQFAGVQLALFYLFKYFTLKWLRVIPCTSSFIEDRSMYS